MADESLVSTPEKNTEPVSLTPVLEKPTQEQTREGVSYVEKKDGRKYMVRDNRLRFFYPGEWILFYDSLKPGKQKNTFDIAMGTGGRINELINIKVEDHDTERNALTLKVTKIRARLGEKKPTPRTLAISSQLSKKIRAMSKGLRPGDKLPLLSKSAATQVLKRHLKKIGIKDWYMFSLHNVRKTHGNYLKALGVDMSEICKRLGHDSDTYLKSYASPDIFTLKDMDQMRIILGDLYQRRIKW